MINNFRIEYYDDVEECKREEYVLVNFKVAEEKEAELITKIGNILYSIEFPEFDGDVTEMEEYITDILSKAVDCEFEILKPKEWYI